MIHIRNPKVVKYLFENGKVYIIRRKREVGINFLNLLPRSANYNTHMDNVVEVVLVKEKPSPYDLDNYVSQSGFGSTREWIESICIRDRINNMYLVILRQDLWKKYKK